MSIVSTLKSTADPRPPRWPAGSRPQSLHLRAPGTGTFLAGSAVFFTQVVGLTKGRSGIGLTIAGIASFFVAVADGASWSTGSARSDVVDQRERSGAMFAVWPFIDSFQEYIAMAVAWRSSATLGGVAHGAYTIDVLPPRSG